jgi:hypothetical protein
MFAKSFFPARHFAPRYFPPIVLAVIITELPLVVGGGGGFYWRPPEELKKDRKLGFTQRDDQEVVELLTMMFQLGVFD